MIRYAAVWLVVMRVVMGCAAGGQATVSWSAPPEPGTTGYKFYYGTTGGSYTEIVDVGATPSVVLTGLVDGTTYHCNVTAYNSAGLEGRFSEEWSFTYLAPPHVTSVSVAGGTVVLGVTSTAALVEVWASSNLTDWTSLGFAMVQDGEVVIPDPFVDGEARRFYKVTR